MSIATHNDSHVADHHAHDASITQSGWWTWIKGAAPTFTVIVMLAVIAAWGHATHWTMPKFSTLVVKDAGPVTAWCSDHNVPEAECIECHPDLLPAEPDHGWCSEHGVANCPLEHPDVGQLKSAPEIDPAERDRSALALTTMPRPENNSRCTLHRNRIQFASVQAIEKAGVDIFVVDRQPISEAIQAQGEVVYDERRMAHLASRVSGTVWSAPKDLGDRVRQGDVVAWIDSAEVGKAKSEFLQAIVQLRLRRAHAERLRPLSNDGIVPGRQSQEAESAHEEAKIQLVSSQQALINLGFEVDADLLSTQSTDQIGREIQRLGLSGEDLKSLPSGLTSSNLLPIRSPLGGIVVNRDLVPGEVVDTSRVLLRVADVSQMWLVLNVRPEDTKYLSMGQEVHFRPGEDLRQPEVTGSITWISTAADDQTRTVKVRVDLANSDERLRANTFGLGRIILRRDPTAMLVPSETVHWDGCCHVVFVRDKRYFQEGAPKFFHVRKVRPGLIENGRTEIIAGLLPGEVIASQNSAVLAAQLLKSNLGAGCCELHAPKK